VRSSIFQVIACAVLMLGAGSAPARAQDDASSKTAAVLDLINRARVQAGVLPVARSSELDESAQSHSVDMVVHDYLDHTGSDGSSPQERADQAGYHVPPNSGWIVVEALSAISAEPSGPVDWWLGDDQHRKVLLNPRWREIGIGYAQGGEYGNYWTADFGCRPGVLPTVVLDGVTYTSREECGDPAVAGAIASTPTPQPLTPTPQPSPTVAPVTATAVPAPARLQASPPVAGPANMTNVQWLGIASPTTTDWIGVFRPGDPDIAPLAWQYVGCAQVPLDARPIGSCNVLLPSTPGDYEIRLFGENAYQRLAQPFPVRVLVTPGA